MRFTFDEYSDLLDCLRKYGYFFSDYRGYEKYEKVVMLRHDVDISLEKAVKFAEIESDRGVKSTYFVLASSDFYNPFSRRSVEMMKKILSFGHDIGLHFDERKYFDKSGDWSEKIIIAKILEEQKILESIIEKDVDVVSMHRPSEETLKADLCIPGMINCYSQKFFKEIKYVSDSYRRWRENIWEVIDCHPKKMQLLTHAFWYNDTSMSRSEVFKAYINHSPDVIYKLIEDNVLPPGVTLKASFMEDYEG